MSDETKTRFGIREITSDQNTPDKSRQFYVNGKKLFIRGTNWIPEGMLRTSDERTYAELRYTKQSGINLIRMWGGGIAESDYFFQLCDEMGLLVWQEFWMTGDTKHPQDKDLYLSNVEATVKRLRNHPSLAYYVSSNESTEMPGAKDLIMKLDGTRGYQMQSECDGVHDGSPYKQVNPMQHYENTASERGSRVDGFNPEYGSPTIPTVETLREVMDEKDLWPINKEVWDYHDGGGFHLMSTMYTDLTNHYGPSSSIEEFATKGQAVGAMNSKSIWEVWNYNKFGYGDRYASGLLFWYHNCPVSQVCARMWDYSLEPTASLYHTQNALEPLHAQFDYLKNTVSVYNDYYQAFKDYKVTAEVYDLNSKKVWGKSQKIDIPEDGVVNDIFTIDFPQNITQVHFIKLRLFDTIHLHWIFCQQGLDAGRRQHQRGLQLDVLVACKGIFADIPQVEDSGGHIQVLLHRSFLQKFVFQSRAYLEQAGADSPGREVQHLTQLAGVVPLGVPQLEQHPVGWVQHTHQAFEVAQADSGRGCFVGWFFVTVGQKRLHQLPLLDRAADLVAVEIPGGGEQPRPALPGVEAFYQCPILQRLEENFLCQVLGAALVAAEPRAEMFQLVPELFIHLIPHGVSPLLSASCRVLSVRRMGSAKCFAFLKKAAMQMHSGSNRVILSRLLSAHPEASLSG